MSPNGLVFNLNNIWEGHDNEKLELLQRLTAFVEDIELKTSISLDAYLDQQKDIELKQETVNTNIAKLQKVKKDHQAELEQIILQRKVTEKKITLANNQRSKLEEDIHDAKLKKESISLEMVELTQELEEARKNRKDRWNAIKNACSFYKENLDIHLGLEELNNPDKVKLTFFRGENLERDKYYVILKKFQDNWKVEHIEPTLKKTHLEAITASMDLTKPLDIGDITKFLYRLRNTFSEYYLKQEK
ncbi:uncharacterized protein [Venturia canescens]|uniref:uncharacterized protein isoform X2 n=1 Tax=Venturia canescens TaxID=32260 RepID=UPI001C9BDE32|nr:uncharacterized protein LOC122412857 isoform X2 [Venturia canescens]